MNILPSGFGPEPFNYLLFVLPLIIGVDGYLFFSSRWNEKTEISQKTRGFWIVLTEIPTAVGLLAYFVGKANVEETLVGADPSQRAVLMALGEQEAIYPIVIGAVFSVLLVVPVILMSRAINARAKVSSPDSSQEN